MEQLQLMKAKRRQAKLAIKKWVGEFQLQNRRMPTDRDTAIIAADVMDFNHFNQQYLDVQLRLLKQNKIPFNPNEFYKAADEQAALQKTKGREKLQRQQTAVNELIKTFASGFGATPKPDRTAEGDVFSQAAATARQQAEADN